MDWLTVEERVKTVIVSWLRVDESEIKPESNYRDDLGADSLDEVELLMAFEEEFGYEISDEEAEKIHTVGETIKFIEKRIKEVNND